MAGLGYKTFTAGEVLTAANLQGYSVDQSIMVFDDSTARTTALGTLVAEGMVSYLKDTDAIEKYDGTAWANISNPGDITAVTAGTGLSGGGTAGDVSLTADFTAIGSTITINNTQIDNTVTSSAATALTLSSSDAGKFIQMTAGSATLTVGTTTDFAVGEQVQVLNDGTALAVIPEDATVELYGRGTAQGTAGFLASNQYDAFSIICVGTDAYRIIGNVEAI